MRRSLMGVQGIRRIAEIASAARKGSLTGRPRRTSLYRYWLDTSTTTDATRQ